MDKEYQPIILGGVLGGLFWYLTQLVAGKDLVASYGYLIVVAYALLGGVIAAFAGVYLFADIDTSDSTKKGKIITNALIAAVAFPSVISSAVVTNKAAVEAKAERIEEAAIEDSRSRTAPEAVSTKSVEQLRNDVKVLRDQAQNGDISVDASMKIEDDLKSLLEPLKEKAEQQPEEAEEIRKIINEIAKPTDTVKVATDKLEELKESSNQQVSNAGSAGLEEVQKELISRDNLNAEIAPPNRPRRRSGPPD